MKSIFALAAKLGGLAAAGYGININNWRDITLGTALAAIVHAIDSIWNSPKAAAPEIVKAP